MPPMAKHLLQRVTIELLGCGLLIISGLCRHCVTIEKRVTVQCTHQITKHLAQLAVTTLFGTSLVQTLRGDTKTVKSVCSLLTKQQV